MYFIILLFVTIVLAIQIGGQSTIINISMEPNSIDLRVNDKFAPEHNLSALYQEFKDALRDKFYTPHKMGCTVPIATNYDNGALINDGSCIFHMSHSNEWIAIDGAVVVMIQDNPSSACFLAYVSSLSNLEPGCRVFINNGYWYLRSVTYSPDGIQCQAYCIHMVYKKF